MPTMRALRPHPWKGRTMPSGATFEATDHEARTIEALRWAVRVGASYHRSDMQAEDPLPSAGVPRGTTRAERRAYRRTDLQAPR